MKSAFFIVLLAAAATAAVVSDKMLDVMKVPDFADVIENNGVSDVDINEMPKNIVIDENELIDVSELTDEVKELQTVAATNLNHGSIDPNEVLVYNRVYKADGIPGQSQTKTIRLSLSSRISSIRVNHVGDSQGATVSIISGGIGSPSVTIRIRSARGRGYHVRVRLFAISG